MTLSVIWRYKNVTFDLPHIYWSMFEGPVEGNYWRVIGTTARLRQLLATTRHCALEMFSKSIHHNHQYYRLYRTFLRSFISGRSLVVTFAISRYCRQHSWARHTIPPLNNVFLTTINLATIRLFVTITVQLFTSK